VDWVKRLVTALSLLTVAAVVLAGCAAGRASAGAGTPARPGRGSPGRAPGLLHGKYQALAVAFPGGGRGLALLSGYPGTSSTVRSWTWARLSHHVWAPFPRLPDPPEGTGPGDQAGQARFHDHGGLRTAGVVFWQAIWSMSIAVNWRSSGASCGAARRHGRP